MRPRPSQATRPPPSSARTPYRSLPDSPVRTSPYGGPGPLALSVLARPLPWGDRYHRRTLDERKAAILRAVVEEYIETAQPVGSGHIAPVMSVSSATVRNDMAV